MLVAVLAVASSAQTGGAMQQRQGILLSAGDGQLTMVGADGKQQSFTVGPTAIVRLNGKPAALEDLKKGSEVALTVDSEGKVVAVSCMLPKQLAVSLTTIGATS